MKIRIRGNSLRIRLSKSEVDLFNKGGYLEETTEFLNNTFHYAVKSIDDETMSATFVNGSITIFVPQRSLHEWGTTNLVSIEHNLPVNNSHLYLLLEKDFKCIDAVITEDQSDYFENPAKSC